MYVSSNQWKSIFLGELGTPIIQLLHDHSFSNVKLKQLESHDEFVVPGEQNLLRSLYHLNAHGIRDKFLAFLANIHPVISFISRKGFL